ncbi:hypothetical protein, partial [Frondihabitans sp. VKM Ac-2883]|uniref:hypothetical protein n=1 Tax=Frondihabitans sp. VKM Ac-2883 TaxID=2783823 RepID=UPI00188D834A
MILPRTTALCLVATLGVTSLIATATTSAHASTSTHAYDLPYNFTRLVLHDTSNPAAGSYIGITSDLRGTRTTTLAEAERAAGGDFFDLPRAGTEGNTISSIVDGDNSGLNLEVAPTQPGGIGYDLDEGDILDDDHQFDVSDDGKVESKAGGFVGFDDELDHLSIDTTGRYELVGSSFGDKPTALVASVDSYNAEAHSAIIRGTASSSVFYPDTRVKIGTSFVATGVAGEFVINAAGLAPDAKTVTVEQWVDDEKFDEQILELESPVDPPVEQAVVLTNPANAAEGYVPNQAFTFRGTAKPEATITIQNT